jgi:probable rRNA maturation factor
MIAIDSQALALVPEADLSKPVLTRFLNRARKLVGLEGDVELLLTSDAELKRLNHAFRNKNKATDILSFPAPPEIAQHHAGDLAISLETAARQAARFGHSLPDEVRILILHGLLHLNGLDHEADKGEMATRESELRAALKLPLSLIARVTPSKKSAKGPSQIMLGQSSRSATKSAKRAESPTHSSRPRKKAAR